MGEKIGSFMEFPMDGHYNESGLELVMVMRQK